MPIITLTTDFGMRDPDLGYLKSRILQTIPDALLVDISHNSTPFDTDESIYIVKNALKNFPVKSIHLIGLDSETHPENYPVLAVSNEHFYLGNDNGIIPAALEGTDYKIYRLPFSKPDVFMQTHIDAIKIILKGMAPDDIGNLTTDYKAIKLSKPSLRYYDNTKKVFMISPKVIYNDNYGNAVFNLTKDEFESHRQGRKFRIEVNSNYHLDKILDYYNDIDVRPLESAAGDIYARFNHYGYFEIFVYKSNQQSGTAKSLLMLRKNSFINIVFER